MPNKIPSLTDIGVKSEIIDFIRRNRVSTTEVADCLDKSGSLVGVTALNKGHFAVGNVFWTYALSESNWTVHEQIVNAKENDVVIIDVFDCGDRAIIGHLVAKYLILYKQVKAIIVRGYVRDVPHLLKENWPIWCTGVTPIGCFNVKPEIMLDEKRLFEKCNQFDNAIAVCDDSGVVIIEEKHQSKAFFKKLEWIEEQEDTWYDCIDRRKWSTYETVCLKKYLGTE